MRGTAPFLLNILGFLFLQGCADTIELPENDLEGKIEGDDWSYGTANAFENKRTTDGQYEVSFIAREESPSNPCQLPSPGLAHVRAIFRPSIGSFTVSPQAISDNQVQVIFQVSNAKAITANSGFMEVFDIRGNTIIGYLQASDDVENTIVEGRVEIDICN